jgi:hypothetical protein
MEIRDSLKQVGKRCEPDNSDFHLEKANTLEELTEIERSLSDEETRKLMVSCFLKCLYVGQLCLVFGIKTNISDSCFNCRHRDFPKLADHLFEITQRTL